mgnify:CR=1 FL=1
MTGGKHSMKTIQWKRSAVVATVLLFVCAAVYLNWRYAGQTAETAKTAAADPADPASAQEGEDQNVKVLGQAALVGGVPTEAEDGTEAMETAGTYFDTARLSRQQSRDNALALLREAAEQEGAEQAAIDEAMKKLENGELHVFDVSTFTVTGENVTADMKTDAEGHLTSYMADVNTDEAYTGDTEVVHDGYFSESEFRSAPYFDLQIDGINLLDTKM